MNEYVAGSQDLRNTRTFNVQGGIKGTLSKNMSFNISAHYRRITNQPLFINENVFSDFYKFKVIYDDLDAYGGNVSLSYQAGDKLRIDGIFEYNKYVTTTELFPWHLPEIQATLRGSYNMFDKIYIKADLNIEAIRMSPVYYVNPLADETIPVDLGPIWDGNLGVEYRYNKRISAFVQFNNIAAQKYFRWNRYRAQAFQVMGGATFSF